MLVGWGVAIGTYPGGIAPAIAKLAADAGATVSVAVGGHEMGQGIRTAITQLVTDDLGIEAAAVEVSVGDTRRVSQHLTAGSWGTATPLPAVHAALRELRRRLELPDAGAVDLPAALGETGAPRIEVEAATMGGEQPADAAVDRLRRGLPAPGGPEFDRFVTFSYIAHFRRGTDRADDGQDPSAARGERRRLRPGRQPGHGHQPGARRRRLGHRRGPARTEPG
jgi:xanthine dehydrogenase YagR molybdenum-binding subunit